MKLKIIVLFLLIICGFTSCQKEVLGKYYNIEDDKALHYIDFKEDGTFFHYYKKGSVERSHSGKWTQEDNKINIFNWEEYSIGYLEIISGMGKVEFGTTLGNQIFWIHGSRLDVTPDGSNYADYIKEEDVEEVRTRRKKREEEREAYLKNKDTFYYPNTKIIKAIGIEEDDSERTVKNYDWKHFYTTGELESEGQYASNRKEGIWKYYYKNGQLRELGAFQDSLRVGTWEYYHESGNLKEKGIHIYIEKGGIDKVSENSSSKYYLTQKRGKWKYYDTDGKLIQTKEFPSREKAYDSLYLSWSDNKDKESVVSDREKRIIEDDKDYNKYKESLAGKK
ncbi:toxin-antitoxin system YwqK family antitoxin [Flavobacterium sp. MDT1-60]|uniref:toxin-antitoxin system YwqK family antitoxin n=1 Tax=Flavobacterium sp. MDT1-60 TaxID=1979344 RepID=UPI001786B4BD|nr:hypothetical protein [Flavobacterium sp. MDT1-60]QOG04353.1 hypothetical protein IHE43_09140 [Flavobacterium sp. MDT1-60]